MASTEVYGNGWVHAYLIKLDAGEHIWSKTIGTEGFETGGDCINTTGGGFAVYGGAYGGFGAGEYDLYLDENISRRYTSMGKELRNAGERLRGWSTSDSNLHGGFIMASATPNIYDNSLRDIARCKNRCTGKPCVGARLTAMAVMTMQTLRCKHPKERYIITGATATIPVSSFAIKTDATGNIQWTRAYEGGGLAYVMNEPAGGYTIYGGKLLPRMELMHI